MSQSDQDFLNSIEELCAIMIADPASVDRKDLELGNKFVGIFEDENFSDGFKNLIDFKEEIIKEALLDISKGAPKLSIGVMGARWLNNQLEKYYINHDELSSGTIVFSLSLKSMTAFKNWRVKGEDDIAQEEINLSCYKLIHYLSQLRKRNGRQNSN